MLVQTVLLVCSMLEQTFVVLGNKAFIFGSQRGIAYFHIQTTRRWGRNTFLITDKHVALFRVCFDAVVVRRRVGQVLISP